MEKNNSLFLFAKTLAGKYSNKSQSQQNPKHFAHINIYFRPLNWATLDGPWLYSEQSYAHAPWSPYRQGLHKISIVNDLIITDNFALKEPERIAGSGFRPELLTTLTKDDFFQRLGCSMHFKQITPGHYTGSVEPGEKCIINRNGHQTYLVSKVEFNNEKWISLDTGCDINNNKKVWGGDHGPLRFEKMEPLDAELKSGWLL